MVLILCMVSVVGWRAAATIRMVLTLLGATQPSPTTPAVQPPYIITMGLAMGLG